MVVGDAILAYIRSVRSSTEARMATLPRPLRADDVPNIPIEDPASTG